MSRGNKKVFKLQAVEGETLAKILKHKKGKVIPQGRTDIN